MLTSLKNKIVLITGASSGIGEACARHFAQQGAKLILTARRVERLEKIASELTTEVLSLQLDVQDKNAVSDAINNLSPEWRNIDILVNNAGLALDSLPIQSGHIEHWETMIQTNVNGLLYVTRAIVPGMVERKTGHVINIGSVAGQDAYANGNVYCATKAAVRAITKSMRIDLLGKNIRVSEIAPAATNTEFCTVRWKDKQRADDFYKDFDPLVADDIADAIIYCVTRPPHVNIAELVIYPTEQATVSLFHREG